MSMGRHALAAVIEADLERGSTPSHDYPPGGSGGDMFSTIFTFLHTDASHFIAAVLVGLYAVGRFNTPRTVRSQTSRFQYLASSIVYTMSCEGIFFFLTWLIEQQQTGILVFLRMGATQPSDPQVSGLEAPLLAALMLTTLLPSFPVLRDLDAKMLATFHRMGAIPFNAVRWGQQLEFTPFVVTQQSLEIAQGYVYGTATLPNALVAQLTADADADKIRHAFTRVIVLYGALRRLNGWARFQDAYPDDATLFDKKMGSCLAHCVGYFALSGQLSQQNLQPAIDAADDITKVMAESDFEVRLMLARVLLYSCPNEAAMAQKLREIGFAMQQPRRIVLPLNLLAFDVLGVIVLFLLATWMSSILSNGGIQIGQAFSIALLIAVNHSIAAVFAVVPKQLWSFANRQSSKERPGLAYLISGLCTLTIGLAVSYCFYIARTNFAADPSQIAPFAEQSKWLLLATVLSIALAFSCDDFLQRSPEPGWLRFVEGAAVAVLMAFVGLIVATWMGPGLTTISKHDQEIRMIMRIALSASIGALFGATIPHWYRNSARQADEMALSRSSVVPMNPAAGA
jgi:hypothetical protein